MPTLTRPTVLLLVLSCLFLSACHVPRPVVRSVLQISPAGAFTLDGKPLMPEQLSGLLAARRAAESDLFVEVRASPEADMSAVKGAIEAVKLAHCRVVFASEDGTR
ncbi:MAG: hypothetical protein QFE16_11920 [Pseudomonadota bacterium]|nr:hypothetical protein [Pseudomonadota bacterium]